MRKGLFFILIVLIMIVCQCKEMKVAYADDEEENIDETVTELLDGLDTSGYDSFIAYLNENEGSTINETIKEMLRDIISGNIDYNFDYFKNIIIKLILGEIGNLIPELLAILLIALLYSILHNLNSGFMQKNVQKIVYIACFGFIVITLGSIVYKSIKRATDTFELLEKFSDLCFPVLMTVISAMGGTASQAVYQPFILAFGSVLLKMIRLVIMPLFYVTFVFGIVGNLSDELKMNKISSSIKSVAEWIMGISFGLFITLLTAEGITGASIDGLASRGAKFALSGYVPIVGNYIKEGFDIVVASCIVIKNALGLCSVVLILVAVIAPIIRVAVIIMLLKLTAGVLEPMTDQKFSSLLSISAESMKILIVAMICASFAALIIIMMILFTCNFGVI